MMKSLLFSGVVLAMSAQSALSATITLPGNTPFNEALGTVTRKTVITTPKTVRTGFQISQRRLFSVQASIPFELEQLPIDEGFIDIRPFVGVRLKSAPIWDLGIATEAALDFGSLSSERSVSTTPVSTDFNIERFDLRNGSGFLFLDATVREVNRFEYEIPSVTGDVPIDEEFNDFLQIDFSQTGVGQSRYDFRNQRVDADIFDLRGRHLDTITFNLRGNEIITSIDPFEMNDITLDYQTRYEYTPASVTNIDPVKTPEPSPLAALIGSGAISLLGSLKKNESNS